MEILSLQLMVRLLFFSNIDQFVMTRFYHHQRMLEQYLQVHHPVYHHDFSNAF